MRCVLIDGVIIHCVLERGRAFSYRSLEASLSCRRNLSANVAAGGRCHILVVVNQAVFGDS